MEDQTHVESIDPQQSVNPVCANFKHASLAALKSVLGPRFELQHCKLKKGCCYSDLTGPVVYFIYNEACDEIICVGATDSLPHRYCDHRKRFDEEMTSAYYIRVHSAERAYIEKFFLVSIGAKYNDQDLSRLIYRTKKIMTSMPYPRSIEYVAGLHTLRLEMKKFRAGLKQRDPRGANAKPMDVSAVMKSILARVNNDHAALAYILNVPLQFIMQWELNCLDKSDYAEIFLDLRCVRRLEDSYCFELSVIRGEHKLKKRTVN